MQRGAQGWGSIGNLPRVYSCGAGFAPAESLRRSQEGRKTRQLRNPRAMHQVPQGGDGMAADHQGTTKAPHLRLAPGSMSPMKVDPA